MRWHPVEYLTKSIALYESIRKTLKDDTHRVGFKQSAISHYREIIGLPADKKSDETVYTTGVKDILPDLFS